MLKTIFSMMSRFQNCELKHSLVEVCALLVHFFQFLHWLNIELMTLNIELVLCCRFTAPVDVAKDAILVAEETLSDERPSFEIGQ